MNSPPAISVEAEPYAYEFEPSRCALVIIDMQGDFLEPGGFGQMLGNDVSQLRRTIEPNRRLLAEWRAQGGIFGWVSDSARILAAHGQGNQRKQEDSNA